MRSQKLVKVNLLGILGESLPRNTYNVAVKTVGNAMSAINVLTHHKFYNTLLENDKKGIKYRVLINGRDFTTEKQPDPNDLESMKNSELCMKINDLETIDVVPILEGAGKSGSIGSIIAGVVLIIVAIVAEIWSYGSSTPYSVALVTAGLGLIAAGVINLLIRPPPAPSLGAQQLTSYLFDGPENTAREGASVPIAYGRLFIGSAIIEASYKQYHFNSGYTSKENVNNPSTLPSPPPDPNTVPTQSQLIPEQSET